MRIMNYINESKKPYPFCPGCSHHMVLDKIGSALEKIGADPKKVVLVSDIGCVGLSDKYFNVHTFHGLHGRSFTYACGVKLANPELLVFVLVGDGGCGIGGHHLINAARKNIGIKVLCFNNHNYGMTGGQHSVTTPYGAKTSTTPLGSLERPIDLAGLVSAAGGSFVGRVKGLDRDLDESIAKAFKHDGFAFLDILEICTAYYSPNNAYRKTEMDELLKSYGFETGIFKEEQFPEYSKILNKTRDQRPETRDQKPRGVAVKYKHNLKKDSYGIVIGGSAGMKVIFAAHNLGEAALMCDLWVSQKDDYPVTVQTGHSVSEIKFAKEKINYLGAGAPDAVIVVSEDGLREVSDKIVSLDKDGIVISKKGLILPKTKAKIHEMDFAGLEKTVYTTAAISKLVNITKILPMEAFEDAVGRIKKEKVRELNFKAVEFGTE